MRLKSNSITSYLLIICLVIGQLTSGCGKKSSENDGKASTTEASPTYSSDNQKFTDSDLDQLLAPIALYPDPLIAQILPAATFIDQLDEANRVLGGKVDNNLIDQQTWDVAVKSVAHYPQVLSMMVQKQDWTIALGQAYVSQQTDVMKSIQRLRQEAYKSGNLTTNQQQKIVVDNGQGGGASDGSQAGQSGTSQPQTVSSGGNTTIKIWPAQPQVIYVPQYDPTVVYEPQPQPSGVSTGTLIATSLLTFGAGLAIGSWLNNDCYWNTWGVGYHGWAGGGWVGYSRNYVHINNVYVNDRFRNVNVNRNIVNRNINNYRSNLRVDGNERVVNRNNFANNRDHAVNHNVLNNDNRTDALRNRDNNRSQLNNYRGYDKSKALSEAGGLSHNENFKNRPNAQSGNLGGNHPAAGSGDRIQNRPNAQSDQHTPLSNRADNHPAANAGNRVQNRPETQQNNRIENHPAVSSNNQFQNRPATQRQNSAFSGIHDGAQAQRNSDRGSQSISSNVSAPVRSGGGDHSFGGGGGVGGGGRSFGGGGGGRMGGRRR